MISPSSLSAFSPSVAPAPTRVAAATSARASQPEQVQKPLQTLPGGTPPTRNAPRGSLLDLSV